MSTESKGLVRITIQSRIDSLCKELTCLTIPAITDLVPSEIFPRKSVEIPANIRLADPDFHLPRPVDLLIGAGATLSLFSIGQINLSREDHDLYLQKTRLGWVVVGGTPAQSVTKPACYVTSLETQLNKFWTIEEITASRPRSKEENECEAYFVNTVRRDNGGRYIVRLPFRGENPRLGESRSMALKRLLSLERKLDANIALRTEYTRVLEEYLKLGHISIVDDPHDDGFYMPHHPVIKESSNTTKVRVVFDASARTSNGISLNDILMTGPTIQDKLFSHLIRFRSYKFVITADIEKMYRQVLLHEDDRRYQRILWRKNDNLETFQLNTLTFGISSSPFLAIRTIQQLANDERLTHPKAAKVLESHLYVDDLLSGAETIEEARAIRDEIIDLLVHGGFVIRQWASNDKKIINDLAESELHANYTVNIDHALKTLGLTWNAHTDKICYLIHPTKITGRLTKRNILSEIAKIFDPLGLLGPVVLYAKKLMQDVWRCGVQWDESVPQSIYTEWAEFTRQLELLTQISFDRRLLMDNYQSFQIHGFCDASNKGYGTCLYVRSKGKHIVAKLLCAKSRVAPLKTTTIPRLELCGALLLARLCQETIEAWDNITPNKVILWCDSTIVLHWLKTPSHHLKTYVANRVAEIQELTSAYEWRHVKSEQNPADAISRGQLPHAFVQNRTWVTGPSWLSNNENEWPNESVQIDKVPEMKTNTCLSVSSRTNFDIWEKYSSYSKLCRIVAYCLRFRLVNKYIGPLGTEEIDAAETRILQIIQAAQFFDEIKRLKAKHSATKSKFLNLSPFLDENGLIWVGGRLQKSNLAFSQRHPVLLPSRHRLTDQIIREIHETHYHTGIQTTLSIVRQRFWILDGRNQIRKIIRACTRCFRYDANTIEYKMGNLPSARVREANTGVDFCGPFYMKEKKYRNKTQIKVYICVFVCMSIKAVHLEIVSDLSSDGFLAALRRFTTRRGLPSHIYSDNGTNFVGANNQLKELYALFNSNEHKESIGRFASEHRITWHFIPPRAPHFGGLWESTVKLFKHHFRRVVGDSLFTFEELNTFTIEIEGVLNSRPITSLSTDPNDMLALTPAHFLIGKPLMSFPEGDISSVPANRLSTWQHITKVRQDFWARWHLEYLNELQKRHKWAKDGPELQVGTVVLIKDKNQPCSQWALGKITELIPGEDGIAQTAIIKTATGELKRTTKLLCPLPIETNQNENKM